MHRHPAPDADADRGELVVPDPDAGEAGTALGQAMADYVATGNADALPMPLQPIRPLPFHALSKAYFAAAVAWYRFLDRRGVADAV